MRTTTLRRTCGVLAMLIGSTTTAGAAQELERHAPPPGTAARADTNPTADVLGTVTDTSSGGPLAGVEIQILRNGQVIAQAETDRLGAYRIHGVRSGAYVVEARLVGFKPDSAPITIGGTGRRAGLLRASLRRRS